MRESGNQKQLYYRYAAIVLLAVFSLSVAFFLLSLWENNQEDPPLWTPTDNGITYQGSRYEVKDSLETFLVLGLDKFSGTGTADSYNNDKQADFLLLLVFDHAAETCSAIHINRDTMAQVNVLGVAGNRVNTLTKQIALAHTYGNGKDVSCRNTADSVSQLLMGIRVNHYLSVTMDAVALLNDMVNGVEVTVLDDFTGIDDTLVKGETVTLVGQQALTYVRTRYGLEDSSNNTRMARQRQYLEALQAKIRQCMDTDEEFLVNAALELSDHIVSDRSVNQLQELVRRFYDYTFTGTVQLQGESRVGTEFMEFYPDADALQKLVIEQFYKLKK